VARANLLALESTFTSALNIGTGVESTVVDLAQRLARHAGVPAQFEYGPGKPGEQRRSSVDAAAARKALGWAATVSLDAGLAQTAAAFRGGP
jgi:UDP-glucose 4-epimerase